MRRRIFAIAVIGAASAGFTGCAVAQVEREKALASEQGIREARRDPVAHRAERRRVKQAKKRVMHDRIVGSDDRAKESRGGAIKSAATSERWQPGRGEASAKTDNDLSKNRNDGSSDGKRLP